MIAALTLTICDGIKMASSSSLFMSSVVPQRTVYKRLDIKKKNQLKTNNNGKITPGAEAQKGHAKLDEANLAC